MSEDQVTHELIKLNAMMEELLRTSKAQRDLLNDIDRVVRLGNGKPPLTERVAKLEDNVGENRNLITKALGAFGIAVTGLVTAAANWFNNG